MQGKYLLPKLSFMQYPSSLVLHRMPRKCDLNLHEHEILKRLYRKRIVLAILASNG